MLAGLALIAAGLGLFLTAGSFFGVAESVNRGLAQRARRAEGARLVIWVHDINARWEAVTTLWFGRLIAVAAIGVGLVLVLGA